MTFTCLLLLFLVGCTTTPLPPQPKPLEPPELPRTAEAAIKLAKQTLENQYGKDYVADRDFTATKTEETWVVIGAPRKGVRTIGEAKVRISSTLIEVETRPIN
jgi:hypothetical protein